MTAAVQGPDGLPLSHHIPRSARRYAGVQTLAVGDHVRHYGTKQWAEIHTIDARHDGTAELVLVDAERKPRYWATYHLDYHVSRGAKENT
jgi:hypothetical protein